MNKRTCSLGIKPITTGGAYTFILKNFRQSTKWRTDHRGTSCAVDVYTLKSYHDNLLRRVCPSSLPVDFGGVHQQRYRVTGNRGPRLHLHRIYRHRPSLGTTGRETLWCPEVCNYCDHPGRTSWFVVCKRHSRIKAYCKSLDCMWVGIERGTLPIFMHCAMLVLSMVGYSGRHNKTLPMVRSLPCTGVSLGSHYIALCHSG